MLFSGLIHVTGEPDSGKTTFAMECGAVPSRMAFIDDDVKGKTIVRQLEEGGEKFAIYHDLIKETKGLKELKFHEYCMNIVSEIVNYKGELDAVVWDTFTRFEQSFKPVVTSNPKNFKDFWSPMGTIKGGEEWVEAQRFEAEVINRMLDKAKMVIVTTHLKPFRIGQKEVPGKFVPRSGAVLQEKSLFRLWLRRNPSGRPVPIALVLKRPSVRKVTNNGIRTINVLPQRISPLPNESSLWDTIARYYKEPFGDRVPAPDETPNEYELSILEGTLTPDQRVALQLVLSESQADVAAVESIELSDKNQDITNDILEYAARNPNAPRKEIVDNVPGATMALVIKARVGK